MILLGIFCNEVYLVRLIRPFKHPLFVVLVFSMLVFSLCSTILNCPPGSNLILVLLHPLLDSGKSWLA